MKKLTMVWMSFGMLAASPALADPSMECSVTTESQVETGNCVGAIGETVDKTVELAFGFAMDSAKELDTTTGRDTASKALNASQQAWSGYRDAHCDYVGSTYGGGSGTGIAIQSCRIELGRQRVSDLMKSLN